MLIVGLMLHKFSPSAVEAALAGCRREFGGKDKEMFKRAVSILGRGIAAGWSG